MNAYAVSLPTNWVYMAYPVGNLLVDIFVTQQLMTSSNVRWHPLKFRLDWNRKVAIVRNNTDDNTDNKRPDGLTIPPWASGRCLVWDFTCSDTLAVSHSNRAVLGPGSTVACDAESRKKSKYASFIPIAVETIGALGDKASAFFKDLSKRIERT